MPHNSPIPKEQNEFPVPEGLDKSPVPKGLEKSSLPEVLKEHSPITLIDAGHSQQQAVFLNCTYSLWDTVNIHINCCLALPAEGGQQHHLLTGSWRKDFSKISMY